MPRRIVAALLAVASVGLLGCRSDTVRLGFEPEAGATYRYRYEIEATITRTVEDQAPRTSRVHMTFESCQTVIEQTDEGTLVEVTLTSAGSAPSTATVLLDRAGSLQAIQQVQGLPAAAAGLPTSALLPSAGTEPPDRPLAIGDQWDISEAPVTGSGRLDSLGVLDGEHAAVVEAEVVEVLTATEESGGSQVVLDGDLPSSTTTAFDLADGSVRRSRTHSTGTVNVLVSPPVGVVAPAVEAVVTYELRVTTTHVDGGCATAAP